ncbi:hypothetical protein CALCODRAFT_486301, partial [Calocera cornea HHB12733]
MHSAATIAVLLSLLAAGALGNPIEGRGLIHQDKMAVGADRAKLQADRASGNFAAIHSDKVNLR